jgi:hypothetical protein
MKTAENRQNVDRIRSYYDVGASRVRTFQPVVGKLAQRFVLGFQPALGPIPRSHDQQLLLNVTHHTCQAPVVVVGWRISERLFSDNATCAHIERVAACLPAFAQEAQQQRSNDCCLTKTLCQHGHPWSKHVVSV